MEMLFIFERSLCILYMYLFYHMLCKEVTKAGADVVLVQSLLQISPHKSTIMEFSFRGLFKSVPKQFP